MPDSPYIVEVGSVQQDELSHLRQILQAAVARLLLIFESCIKTLKGPFSTEHEAGAGDWPKTSTHLSSNTWISKKSKNLGVL